RRTVAQFVGVQLNQIEGVQEQAAVVVAMEQPGTGRPTENKTPRMPLTRLKDSAFDPQVGRGRLAIANGSSTLRCLVSQEALTDKAEEASLAESLDVFHEYRSEIENLASAKYDAGQIKSDGLVVVDSADLNPEQFQQGLA